MGKCNCKEKQTGKSGLLPMLLAFTGMFILFWLRRRFFRQIREDRLAAQRRPVEVVSETGATDIIAPAEEQGIEIENIPEMEAGSGAVMETRAAQMEAPGGDDLEIIEGIGPKISSVLQQAGIQTFAQLAEIEVAALEEILHAAGMRRNIIPQTWPEQASLAATGNWDALEALQKQLKGGRKV